MLGVDFDVDGPPELVEHLVTLGKRLGRVGEAARTSTAAG